MDLLKWTSEILHKNTGKAASLAKRMATTTFLPFFILAFRI